MQIGLDLDLGFMDVLMVYHCKAPQKAKEDVWFESRLGIQIPTDGDDWLSDGQRGSGQGDNGRNGRWLGLSFNLSAGRPMGQKV